MRLDYRLALADVNYRDHAIGIEAANALQNAVDVVVIGGDWLPPKYNLNRFQLEQEKYRLEEQKREIKRNENLDKRRRELKKILAGEAKTSEVEKNGDISATPKKKDFIYNRNSSASKSNYQNKSLIGKSMMRAGSMNKSSATNVFDSQSTNLLRTPKYLSELKAKATEIKHRKDEAKTIGERERKKQQELMMFIKKKKNTEFIHQKVDNYDQKFSKIFKERYNQEQKQSQDVKKAREEINTELKQAAVVHAADIKEHKQEKEALQALYKACESEVAKQDSQSLEILLTVFLKYNKLQDQWTVLNDENLCELLQNKLALKVFTESRVVPEIISLKKLVELVGKSAKKQKNSLYMSFDEFKELCYDIAIDANRYGVKDPFYARSTRTGKPTSALASVKRNNTLEESQSPLRKSKLPAGFKEEGLISADLNSPLARAFKIEPTISLQKTTLGREHTAAIEPSAIILKCQKMIAMMDDCGLNKDVV